MSSYRIYETRRFLKDLDDLLASGRRGMERKLRECVYPQLRVCPHFGPNIKKLRDQVTATWRCRIGDWRFFYSIDEGERVVFMTGAAHRSSAY